MVEKREKSFATSTRIEAVAAAETWSAEQENVRRLDQTVIDIRDQAEQSRSTRRPQDYSEPSWATRATGERRQRVTTKANALGAQWYASGGGRGITS
jgi:hypothetical protein